MRRVFAGAAIVAAVVAGTMSPANATASRIYTSQGSDTGYADLGYNCSTNNSAHKCFQHYAQVAIADKEKDGHSAVIYFKDNNGRTAHFSDHDGANNGYNVLNLHIDGGRYAVWVQVCEGEAPNYNDSCGPRVNTPGFWVEAA